MDVGGQHAEEEEDAVDEDVGAEAGDDHNGGGREEDIDEGEAEAGEDHFGGSLGGYIGGTGLRWFLRWCLVVVLWFWIVVAP